MNTNVSSPITQPTKHQFSNLVFEGGGVLGAAEVGAYITLLQSGHLNNVQSVVGTSAGSILATLVAIGATTDQIRHAIFTCPFGTFKDLYPGLVSYRFLTRFGIYRGDAFTRWFTLTCQSILDTPINKSLGITSFHSLTFKQLDQWMSSKNLAIIAYNLDRGQSQTYDVAYTPNTRIVDAVRASIAIPGFFAGQLLTLGSVSYLNVDGGVSANYPIRHYDLLSPNPYTLGIRVDSTSDHRRYLYAQPLHRYFNRFLSPAECTRRLLSALYHKANGVHLDPADWNRTVFCDSLGISATNFDITQQEVQSLYESGVEGAEKYVKWLASISPLNPVQAVGDVK